MRRLAAHKYGLQFADVNMTSQQSSQQLDILMIMRRLNVFTQHYTYNLNMQVRS